MSGQYEGLDADTAYDLYDAAEPGPDDREQYEIDEMEAGELEDQEGV